MTILKVLQSARVPVESLPGGEDYKAVEVRFDHCSPEYRFMDSGKVVCIVHEGLGAEFLYADTHAEGITRIVKEFQNAIRYRYNR